MRVKLWVFNTAIYGKMNGVSLILLSSVVSDFILSSINFMIYKLMIFDVLTCFYIHCP